MTLISPATEPALIDPQSVERSIEDRRVLGAYYTPDRLSGLLARWAIQTPTEIVLEPSFGGCGFLSAALDRLRAKGADLPEKQVFGCDVDPLAFKFLEKVLPDGVATSNFLLQDFLDPVAKVDWPSEFDVILANPPYIPHHRIGKERVKELSKRPWPVKGMGGRASLWAYFVAHSLEYLKEGGRMAWVLPGAFMQADYGKPLRAFIADNFRRSVVFLVHDRIFKTEGTDEETVVLLAQGYRSTEAPGILEVGEADSLNMLGDLIAAWESGHWMGKRQQRSAASLSLHHEAEEGFHAFSTLPNCRKFSDFARVQIGLVTGANDFFVLSEAGRLDANLEPHDCKPIFSKFRAAPGLKLVDADLRRYENEGGKTHLVSSSNPGYPGPIGAYLSTFGDARREVNSTFRKRAVWSRTYDGRVPDAFFPVMHHAGPRLVLNGAGCSCTNTIHRVFFNDQVDEVTAKLLAITMLTSFTQVSAELTGRRYGSGVLKHEPRDAENLCLLVPDVTNLEIDEQFRQIETIARTGDVRCTMRVADEFIYSRLGYIGYEPVQDAMVQALTRMRERRRPSRR